MTTADLLGGPLAQAIGLALLHALWQGAIVAGVLAALLALFSRRSAALRYAIACAALAVVFVLAVVTGVRSYTPRAPESMTTLVAPPAAFPSSEDSVFIEASTAPRSWNERWLAAVAAVRAHIPEVDVIWLAGVLLLTLRLAASWTRTRALANRGAVAADEAWQRIAARLSLALGMLKPVRLVVSGGVDVPSVVGWLKPSILLPVSSFTGLTSEQLEMVLAHELAHIRRHDFLVNAMQSVVETLLFYHPAVWYVSRQIRIERENCCDDLAVSVCGDAILYARALAQLEELRATPLMAVAANGGSLLDRVRRLVGARRDRSLFASGWTAAAAMASFIALLAVTTAPILAERRQTPPPAPTPGTQIEVRAPQPTPRSDVNADEPEVDVDMDTDMDTPPTPEPPDPPDPPDQMVLSIPTVAPLATVVSTPAIAPRVRIHPAAIARVTRNAARMAMAVAGGVEGGIAGDVYVIDSDDEQSKSPTPPGKLSVDDLISLRVHGVTPEYIQQMRDIGFGSLSLRDVSSLRSQGVTPEYIGKMRAAGLGDLSARDILSLRVQGVTPDYVSALRASGVQIKTARDVVMLRVQGVTPEFVKSLATAGYVNLTVRDLVRLGAAGVNADFIREMSKYKK